MIAVAPEMRRWADKYMYFPEIANIGVTMIDYTTAKVNATLKWNSKLASLHPVVRVSTWFKIFEESDLVGGCTPNPMEPPKCEAISTTEATRNLTLVQTIPNLRRHEKYYVEVKAYIEDQWRYGRLVGASKSYTFVARSFKGN